MKSTVTTQPSKSTTASRVCTVGLSGLLAAALAIAGGSAASAAPQGAYVDPPVAVGGTSSATDSQKAADLTVVLEQIMSVPDEVLQQGDAATLEWIETNIGAIPDGSAGVTPGGEFSTQASIPGCIGSIAVALAGVAFPAAKLLKIKKLADELGGVAKAVELLWGASFNYEKVQAAGGALASLGAELIGIASIKEQCFE